MKWKLSFPTSRIECIVEEKGESIEQKMRKVTSSKEPIENVAPLIYTERKDGVLPQYDYRTDRFELARQAKDKYYGIRSQAIENAQKAAEEKAKAIVEGKQQPEA